MGKNRANHYLNNGLFFIIVIQRSGPTKMFNNLISNSGIHLNTVCFDSVFFPVQV